MSNTLTENKENWEKFDWTAGDKLAGGERWSGAFGNSEAQWHFAILPRIHRHLPTRVICEIAPGYGRWSKFLLDSCQTYWGVDIVDRCVQACLDRFKAYKNARFFVGDGATLQPIEDHSVDLVFSFDSLVHCDAETMGSYVPEIIRTLKPQGRAFIHHSNLRECPAALADKESPIHWRATNVSAAIVRGMITQAGGTVYSQELINWSNTSHLIDCITTFGCASDHVVHSEIVENKDFMRFASVVGNIASLYCR
jgi:ubiquinone/menaquinone biosynthesis C-methylase UbiE